MNEKTCCISAISVCFDSLCILPVIHDMYVFPVYDETPGGALPDFYLFAFVLTVVFESVDHETSWCESVIHG